MTAEQDRRAGGTMESHISYYDVEGKLKEVTPPYGSDRHSLTAHYRTVAAKMGAGSIAVFPLRTAIFLHATTRPIRDTSGTAPGGAGLDWECTSTPTTIPPSIHG